MRSRSPDIPFIIVTGKGSEVVVIRAINNGAGYYLQKDLDMNLQYIEVAHKVKTAIRRRKQSEALRESEQHLADIFDFLSDPTFAIDISGRVIAWNRAIQEISGISKAEMIGQGEYAYSVPFYGRRRPVLVDFVLSPDDENSAALYPVISKEKDTLYAEISQALIRGEERYLVGKASRLYNPKGEVVGAIETIRDITAHKDAITALRESEEQVRKSKTLGILNHIISRANAAEDLSSLSPGDPR